MGVEKTHTDDSPLTLSKRIADTLARRIVDGVYPKDTRLPTERELAVEFNTYRNAVREALKRLEAVGVLESRRGAGTFVKGVELGLGVRLMDTLIRHEDGSINLQSLREVLEFRGNMARLVVRAAAARRTPEQMAEIRRLAVERRKYRDHPEKLRRVMEDMFRVIAEASHNRAYMLLHNTAIQAYIQLWQAVDLPHFGPERLDTVTELLVEALDKRDPVGAELVLVRFMEAMQRIMFGDVDPATSAPFAIRPEPDA